MFPIPGKQALLKALFDDRRRHITTQDRFFPSIGCLSEKAASHMLSDVRAALYGALALKSNLAALVEIDQPTDKY